MTREEAFRLAENKGFSHWGYFDASGLRIMDEVRDMCASDKCRMYGRNWSCPPACGSLDDVRDKADSYSWGILLQTTGHMEDSFDYEAMRETEERHKRMLSGLCDSISADTEYLALGSGACTLCTECTYPESPCRHPDRMISSMESYGLMVSDVCAIAGLPYRYDELSVTYTGCVLFV